MWNLIIPVACMLVLVASQFLMFKKFGKDLGEELPKFIKEIFVDPTVSRGFSLMGALGGNARATKEIKNKMAQSFIDKNYGLLKIGAEQILGLDVDELIEEYGAENIMTAIQEFLPSLGLDISQLTPQMLSGFGATSTGNLPKWHRGG